MKMGDLRLGNWVYNSRGEYYKIDRLNDYLSSIFEPILLDENLYRKIASNPNNNLCLDNNFTTTGKKIEVKFLFNSLFVVSSFRNFEGLLREVKYVHQLQNLFYDLTGKELEIDLKK